MSAAMFEYDFLVIGGGSGGIAAARRAAKYGARVALVEPKPLGGTCVNAGCVPKKLMFNAAQIAELARHAAGYGFKLDKPRVDWLGLKRRRDAAVSRLNGIYKQNLEGDSVQVIDGRAKFLDPHTLEAGGRRYKAAHVLVATGGAPRMPQLPGAQLGITSDGFFSLAQQPRSLAIVGAGYIGVELAGVLRSLGSDVTLVSRYGEVLPGFDDCLKTTAHEGLTELGVELATEFEPAKLTRTDDGSLRLTGEDRRELTGFDQVIWAVGRAPATAGLRLEAAGVQLTPQGFVQVDPFQNTTTDGVYAVGDVTGQMSLTPVAIAAGRALAERLFNGQQDSKVDYENIPTVVFSHPPCATVGLSQADAESRLTDVRCYTTEFVNLFYSLGNAKPKTRMKVVTAGPQERVVGIHVAGLGADEMIQGFAVALKLGACKADLDRTMAIHPTAAEELVTLR